MEILLIIGFAVLIYLLNSQSKKIDWLIEEVLRMRGGATPKKDVEEVVNVMQTQISPSIPTAPSAPPVPSPAPHEEIPGAAAVTASLSDDQRAVLEKYMPEQQTATESRFVAWVKEDFMVKLGAFFLLLALGWFVSYAFIHDWIGEVGRIMLGLITGIGFMVLGVWRIKTYVQQGGIFTVLGSTVILITLIAARQLYDFFTPMSAVGIMLLSIAFVAFVSVQYNRNALALAGLVLASFAPQFINGASPTVLEMHVYLLVIILGTLWVVFLRRWSNLTLTTFIIVAVHSISYLPNTRIPNAENDLALMFAFLFTALFFVANIIGLIANESKANRLPHILIAVGTSLYLILWISGAAEKEWQSLLYVVWMLVFSFGSYIVFRVLESKVPFYIYGSTSLILLATATAAELSGPILFIAYTVEVSLLVMLAARFLAPSVATVLSWLYVPLVFISFEYLASPSWDRTLFHDAFFALGVLTLSLGFTAHIIHTHRVLRAGEGLTIVGVLATGAALYGLILVWLIFHVPTVAGGDAGTMISLIIYTVLGISSHLYGKRNENREIALGGNILLGFVIARLLLIEVWEMELAGRIITFVVIGLLLISTAFIRNQKQSSAVMSEKNNSSI